MRFAAVWVLGVVCVSGSLMTGCVQKVPTANGGGAATGGTSSGKDGATAGATISIHGSSTVYPISQAIAEAFKATQPAVEVNVGQSGTSGGFGKFKLKEIDICNASRPITKSEIEACANNGVEWLELTVAIDALTVAVNPANDWVDCISIAQLKKIWEPGSTVKKWSDVDPQWPDKEIKLFGADTDSGTFDYFTEVVNGKAKQSRTEYMANSNDNILVQGVADDRYGLGYFGYGYYVENQQRLKALAVRATDDGECVAPTAENVDAGKYVPLARPLFVYVNKASLKRPEVAGYLNYFLSDAGQAAVVERKFIRMPPNALQDMRQKLADAIGGT